MKTLIVILLFFTACQPIHHTYANHTEGPYSNAVDTLSIENKLITNAAAIEKSATDI